MSRNNRDRWVFVKNQVRKPLSVEEVRYWKNLLVKILKVGFEFEFNLDDRNGTCHGNNDACQCTKMAAWSCWKSCIHYSACEMKAEEEGRQFECYGLFCTRFESACLICGNHETNCQNCQDRFDIERSPDYVRNKMCEELCPSNTYGTLTKYGVHSIKTDGSLLGGRGAEIITSGRRADFWEYYKMIKKIIDTALARRAYVNERCSIHAHLLTAYYGKIHGEGNADTPNSINELEKPIPEIILANFHQLCRRYQNAITWMTMGLSEENRLTRWEKFRVSILEISPLGNSMPKVAAKVYANAGDSKYGWVNYIHSSFNSAGDATRFHVEMRVMDALLAPSAVAAMGCLYVALLLKAAELSRYGLLDIGKNTQLQEMLTIKEALLNNRKGYNEGDRFSNTEHLKKYYPTLIEESLELISQLKHLLAKFGPCYKVLEALAVEPCALRRARGLSWEEIEDAIKVELESDSIIDTKIGELVDTRAVDKCTTKEEWIHAIAEILYGDAELMFALNVQFDELVEKVKQYLESKEQSGELIWLGTAGTMSFV